ncbi:unnamed protein product [Periconia digitata]|uniref:Uncharacterized protein n=1 Tax=Periconia digitata TaxID=1303443 RepID=A0A9W4XGL6_9PLEO|nr:unnamed protein product [Periconia digitata]
MSTRPHAWTLRKISPTIDSTSLSSCPWVCPGNWVRYSIANHWKEGTYAFIASNVKQVNFLKIKM